MNKQGIRDLMKIQRYRASHLQDSLIKEKVPGNWVGKTGLQNVYNLINGRVMPKDAYVFIFLSNFLQIRLSNILLRFSGKKEKINNSKSTLVEGKISW